MDTGRRDTEHTKLEYEQEIEALKERIKWLSEQRYGRVLPGLLDFSTQKPGNASPVDETARPGHEPGQRVPAPEIAPEPGREGILRESSAPYRVSGGKKARERSDAEQAASGEQFPTDAGRLPEDETTLELPPRERAGMTAVGFEDFEAVAMRPAVVRRRIRRAMYAAMDGSGLAAAAPVPALFDDPSGGAVKFDASFAAWAASMRVAGHSFREIADRLKREDGLEVSEETLRALFAAVAEAVGPVCTAMFLGALPEWDNLRRMFEASSSAGDWMAEEFLKKIHALAVLEDNARTRADRLGGAPEDLYRERRALRAQSRRVVTEFFRRCRELGPALASGTPLEETVRYAIEHETVLSEYLYDPRVEMTGASTEGFRPDPLVSLEICAAECERRGAVFRVWLEETLVQLKRTPPPPPETLFPR